MDQVCPHDLITRCAADIEPERVEWLWPGRLAKGKHTCIAGEPGTGKSQLSIFIVAAITTGGLWPCGEGRAPLGNVIILSAEDGASDTIVPRLIAAGANLSRVHMIDAVRADDGKGRKSFSLQADLDLLEEKIAQIGDAALIIVDPISSYMGKADSHKNAEVRGVLEPVGEMADRLRVAVLSITHFSKVGPGNTTKVLHRFIGSIAFTGAPRAAFAVIEDPEDKDCRLLLHAKNNLAPPPQGLAFRLVQTLIDPDKNIVASSVSWDPNPVTMSADQAVTPAYRNADRTAKDEARDFLKQILANGPVTVGEIEKEAREARFLKTDTPLNDSKPIRSAKAALGIQSRKGGLQDGWVWEMPSGPKLCLK